MKLLAGTLFSVLFSLTFSVHASTTHWQLHFDHKILNANFIDTGARDIVYLVVHGTWAHQDMEIISAFQDLLQEHEASSLAITLSIGESNRSGFLGCEAPIYGTQDLAVKEIDIWVEALRFRGFEKVVLVAHSRGGAQAALYEKQHPGGVNQMALLAPMVWNQERANTSYNSRSHHRLDTVLDIARSSGSQLIGPFPLINCDSIEATPAAFLSYYSNTVEKHSPELLRSATIPIHVFLGSEDQVARWTEEDIKVASANTHVEITTIEGAGHFFRDLYLDDVVDLLMATGE